MILSSCMKRLRSRVRLRSQHTLGGFGDRARPSKRWEWWDGCHRMPIDCKAMDILWFISALQYEAGSFFVWGGAAWFHDWHPKQTRTWSCCAYSFLATWHDSNFKAGHHPCAEQLWLCIHRSNLIPMIGPFPVALLTHQWKIGHLVLDSLWHLCWTRWGFAQWHLEKQEFWGWWQASTAFQWHDVTWLGG